MQQGSRCWCSPHELRTTPCYAIYKWAFVHVAGYRFWVTPGSRVHTWHWRSLQTLYCLRTTALQLCRSRILSNMMMEGCQPQCSDLQSLAEALAVDFVGGGASVCSQTQQLLHRAFPDAPALRCGRYSTNNHTCQRGQTCSQSQEIDTAPCVRSLALLARHQLVTLDLSKRGGAISASDSSQALAALACISSNAVHCSASR